MRIIAQLGATSADDIRAAYPDVEIIEFAGGDPPPDLKADVFFGGYLGWDDIVRWIDAAGVQWVQLSGTGVDKVPATVYEHGRIVTCARGASAVPSASHTTSNTPSAAFNRSHTSVAPECFTTLFIASFTIRNRSCRTSGESGWAGMASETSNRQQMPVGRKNCCENWQR